MVWEGEPHKATEEKLKSMGINSIIINPSGNVPQRGDFLSVMQENVHTLKIIFMNQ